jgi:hypothetical protein
MAIFKKRGEWAAFAATSDIEYFPSLLNPEGTLHPPVRGAATVRAKSVAGWSDSVK